MSLSKEQGQLIIELYDEGYGTTEIAARLNTYPNKINRFLVKSGRKLRTRSEAQKLALEKGTTQHPTEGKKRSEEEKVNISKGLADWWDKLDDEEKERRRQLAKDIWDSRPLELQDRVKNLAAQGLGKASKEGSQLEKFLKKELAKRGYNVIYHKTGLIQNSNLEVDIFLPNEKLVIEIDGPTHFFPIWGEERLRKVQESDTEKNGLLLANGFTVLRLKYVAKRLSGSKKRAVLEAIVNFVESNPKQGTITEIEVT